MELSSKERRGLMIVNTGEGKGKTTAALGMIFRALGRGMRCGIVQFIKGKWETGERKFAKTIPELDFYVMGLGFTWDSEDLDKDKKAALAAWELSKKMILGGDHALVVLDEITYAFHFGWIDVKEASDVFKTRPSHVHIVLTGRNCPELLLEQADLVSKIEAVKHPFQIGIKAQAGIDF
ncbi:cob(I)yrinic acid a,c-diamide adenosyltransferase [Leptospira broomii serovar Hurstbridge str. 5399]|uniref:corrinoid adenosyltransferase n=1 Tax=Leptospira broomii serovar Hurstbridge str. 5399 TaxID=1049789 RepID=T0GH53_9LEPT|nr:cob(I)yrinic acid a,c-diamide adenosyltransferase [Leptospira broomii]EQA44733.1 cob(I)yrinic acid a,c-diamide adenosyltransferase [Leptospira broomii serovar Hurstbridge str. 5399]